MVLINYKTFIMVYLFFVSIRLHSQSYTYDLISKKDTIGVLNVSKKLNAKNESVFSYNADIKVSLLMKIHLKYAIETIYDDEKLLHSKVNTVL